MRVRSDIIQAIEYEDYFGENFAETLQNLQESDDSYTEKDAEDYVSLTYHYDQLEWASLDDGIICTTKIFKKGDEYWGTLWYDTGGNDTVDAYVDLELLEVGTKVHYTPRNIPEIPAVAINDSVD